MQYTCLKPKHGECDYYLHMSLDDQNQRLTLYYQRMFYDGANMQDLETYYQKFTQCASLITLSRRGLKQTANTVRIKGKCFLHRNLLKDIMGFVEPHTLRALPARINITVNRINKFVDVHIVMPYRALGGWHRELQNFNIFSSKTDKEYVRSNLKFFHTKYFASDKHTTVEPVSQPEPRPEFQADEKFNGDEHPYAKGTVTRDAKGTVTRDAKGTNT